MPLNDPSPNFALITSFDARQWSGVTVFEQNGNSITLPTFAAGAGVYEDALFFLNGRSSLSSLTELVSALATFGSDWKVEINGDDLLEISNASTAFSIAPIGDDVFGWGTQTASVVGGRLVVTAELDWMRGIYLGGRFTLTSGGGSFTAPFVNDAAKAPRQDIMTLLRNRGVTSDADELYSTTCLEALHEAAQSSSYSTFFWLINDDGHVEAHYPTSYGAITWASTSFRDRLGFSGDEVADHPFTAYDRITADRPLPGALFPSRPYQAHFYSTETMSTARRLLGGGYVSNFLGSYVTSNLTFDLDALLDQTDLYRHFTEGFLPYCGEGERINLYQGWGDARRSLRSGLVSSNQPAYDLLYTSENNGDLGRLRCSMRSTDFDLSFGALKKRVPVTVSLEHL